MLPTLTSKNGKHVSVRISFTVRRIEKCWIVARVFLHFPFPPPETESCCFFSPKKCSENLKYLFLFCILFFVPITALLNLCTNTGKYSRYAYFSNYVNLRILIPIRVSWWYAFRIHKCKMKIFLFYLKCEFTSFFCKRNTVQWFITKNLFCSI